MNNKNNNNEKRISTFFKVLKDKFLLAPLKYVSVFVAGVVFASGLVYAWNAVWHGTNWVQNGKVINAKSIGESLQYLYEQVESLKTNTISGGFNNVVVYSTPGTYNFTVPNGVTRLFVEVYGAGGGGGRGGKNGEPTYFAQSLNIEISASGGYGATGGGGGAGGIGISGDIIQNGGAGQTGTTRGSFAGIGGSNTRSAGGRGSYVPTPGGPFGGGGGYRIDAGGGGAGGVAMGFVSVTPGDVIPITVGADGLGGRGTQNKGGDGGVIIWW